jgi:hypothetical protein
MPHVLSEVFIYAPFAGITQIRFDGSGLRAHSQPPAAAPRFEPTLARYALWVRPGARMRAYPAASRVAML